MTTMTSPHPSRKRGPAPGERFDLAALENFLLGRDSEMRKQSGYRDYPVDRVLPSYIAKVCGVQRTVVNRWRNEGLTAWAADRAACAVGMHPISIWPEWERGGTPKCA